MRPPKLTPYPPALRYKSIVVRSIRYDMEELVIDVQGRGFAFARVVFRDPVGFRVLNEIDLLEFWKDYHPGNGWFCQVHEGGWAELETQRGSFRAFGAPESLDELSEYLIVCDQCISVLAVEPPEIIDIGADPEGGASG